MSSNIMRFNVVVLDEARIAGAASAIKRRAESNNIKPSDSAASTLQLDIFCRLDMIWTY
jgi:hypothetical protein